jgi:hypothetical protein
MPSTKSPKGENGVENGTHSKTLLASTGEAPSARELQVEEAEDPTVEIQYTTETNLAALLHDNRNAVVHVQVSDVIDMIAELRRVNRQDLLKHAVIAWFYHALGFPVLEAECKEQPTEEDPGGGLVLFRARLDADYDKELAAVPKGKKFEDHLQELLVNALPGLSTKGTTAKGLNQMVKVNHVKAGTIEIGGVAAIGVIILIVMAIGLGSCGCELCKCSFCPCFARPGKKEGEEYACAIRELQERGASFEISPDCTATIRIPKGSENKWKCPIDDCVIS